MYLISFKILIDPILNSSILIFSLPAASIFCYKCESYRDFRCLDPFDYRPFPKVNCDFEPFARDRKPVFCEKTTDLSKCCNI